MQTDEKAPLGNNQAPLQESLVTDSAIAVPAQGAPMRDGLLWLIALSGLVGSTLVNQYLPAYWAPASSVWVRVGVIAGLVVVSLALLYLTQAGKSFGGLLKASRLELRRITWPTSQETIQTTWIVMAVVIVMALLLWGMDTVFGWFISSIIG